jgi:hypothetical protein
MEGYRRMIKGIFDDGIVNIGRIRIVLMVTKRLVERDPERFRECWSEFYDVFMSLSHPTCYLVDYKNQGA